MTDRSGNVSVAQRIIIKFLCYENGKSFEIFERLLQQYGEDTLSKFQGVTS